ncbi:tryptophan-rich sensory protein [Alphaproteobacteria bacterium]|nr:tryptophan-rich sensory protein [Alphaproteobacteria bacterium]
MLNRDTIALTGFLILCLGVGAIGGITTAETVGSWYQTLVRPSFNPPDWIFGPVWTALYILMAFAGWRVWKSDQAPGRGRALMLFGIQLAFNLIWSQIFFGLQQVVFAFLDIILLDVAVIATLFFFRQIDRVAGWLFVPYLVWILFATFLNAAIWYLN